MSSVRTMLRAKRSICVSGWMRSHSGLWHAICDTDNRRTVCGALICELTNYRFRMTTETKCKKCARWSS